VSYVVSWFEEGTECDVLWFAALESALSKVRGKYGAEMIGKQEYTALRGGFHEFEYVHTCHIENQAELSTTL
jgi:hypothetical protein